MSEESGSGRLVWKPRLSKFTRDFKNHFVRGQITNPSWNGILFKNSQRLAIARELRIYHNSPAAVNAVSKFLGLTGHNRSKRIYEIITGFRKHGGLPWQCDGDGKGAPLLDAISEDLVTKKIVDHRLQKEDPNDKTKFLSPLSVRESYDFVLEQAVETAHRRGKTSSRETVELSLNTIKKYIKRAGGIVVKNPQTTTQQRLKAGKSHLSFISQSVANAVGDNNPRYKMNMDCTTLCMSTQADGVVDIDVSKLTDAQIDELEKQPLRALGGNELNLFFKVAVLCDATGDLGHTCVILKDPKIPEGKFVVQKLRGAMQGVGDHNMWLVTAQSRTLTTGFWDWWTKTVLIDFCNRVRHETQPMEDSRVLGPSSVLSASSSASPSPSELDLPVVRPPEFASAFEAAAVKSAAALIASSRVSARSSSRSSPRASSRSSPHASKRSRASSSVRTSSVNADEDAADELAELLRAHTAPSNSPFGSFHTDKRIITLEIDGEYAQVMSFFGDGIFELLAEAGIVVIENPSALTHLIGNALDISKFFMALKNLLRDMCRNGKLPDPFIHTNVKAAVKNLSSNFSSFTSAQIKKLSTGISYIIHAFTHTTIADHIKKAYRISGKHPLSSDITFDLCQNAAVATHEIKELIKEKMPAMLKYFCQHGHIPDRALVEVFGMPFSAELDKSSLTLIQQRAVILINSSTVQRLHSVQAEKQQKSADVLAKRAARIHTSALKKTGNSAPAASTAAPVESVSRWSIFSSSIVSASTSVLSAGRYVSSSLHHVFAAGTTSAVSKKRERAAAFGVKPASSSTTKKAKTKAELAEMLAASEAARVQIQANFAALQQSSSASPPLPSRTRKSRESRK